MKSPFVSLLSLFHFASRLDFEAFNIGQPNVNTLCSTDTFRVGGAVNKVPVICGHNGGQHSKRRVSSLSYSALVTSF